MSKIGLNRTNKKFSKTLQSNVNGPEQHTKSPLLFSGHFKVFPKLKINDLKSTKNKERMKSIEIIQKNNIYNILPCHLAVDLTANFAVMNLNLIFFFTKRFILKTLLVVTL